MVIMSFIIIIMSFLMIIMSFLMITFSFIMIIMSFIMISMYGEVKLIYDLIIRLSVFVGPLRYLFLLMYRCFPFLIYSSAESYSFKLPMQSAHNVFLFTFLSIILELLFKHWVLHIWTPSEQIKTPLSRKRSFYGVARIQLAYWSGQGWRGCILYPHFWR